MATLPVRGHVIGCVVQPEQEPAEYLRELPAPSGFREQRDMAIYFQGTRDILKYILGNKRSVEL